MLSVSQVTGLVSVKLDPEEKGQYSPRYCDTVEVPKTRVQPSRNQVCTVQSFNGIRYTRTMVYNCNFH